MSPVFSYLDYLRQYQVAFTLAGQCRREPDHNGPLLSATLNPKIHNLPDGQTIVEYFSFANNLGSDHATLSTARTLIYFSDKIKNQAILEMGCGTGILSIIAAKAGARVTSTDIDLTTLALTKKNALANGVNLDIRHGSLCEPLMKDERFDWCICNLPQKPGAIEDGLPASQSGGPEGDMLMSKAVSGLINHQIKGDRLLFFSHSLMHPRLLNQLAKFYQIELWSWKLRWFMEDEYGPLHKTFRERHHLKTSFIWTENGREAIIGCVWIGTRLDEKNETGSKRR